MQCRSIRLIMGLFFTMASLRGNAQYENVWAINNYGGLDFNSGRPVAIETSIEGYGEAVASVCDESGALLFYTEGSFVWDRNGDLMPNGSDLTQLTSMYVTSVTSSTTQGALIIPMPGNPHMYYIFSLTSMESGYYGSVYYSIVDMRLNNGFGDIVTGEKGILLDTRLTEKMTGIVGDRCNIWLLVHAQSSNEFRAWEITTSGISDSAVVSAAGSFLYYDFGMLSPSLDRKKLATCSSDGLELYDFDPVTGMISNPIVLDQGDYYGVVFSPDGSKLYATPNDFNASVFQFNLEASNPVNTKVGVGTTGFTQLKTATDGKVYLKGLGSTTLSVINFPNLSGSACLFVPDAITLLPGTAFMNAGLPNVVPVIPKDTFLSAEAIEARECWANVNQPSIKAQNDSTGWDYVWNTGGTEPELAADTPGVYRVTYRTPPCNYHVDTFHVSFSNGVLPTIHSLPECGSNNNGSAYAATYAGDPVSYSYTWIHGTDTLSITDTLANVPSGSYRLHVQTNTGCDTQLVFDIPEENFGVSFSASDTLICLGDTIQLANTSDAHFTQYHWAFDNGDTSALQNPLPYVYGESGAYRLMLAGTGPICVDTTYQTILVDQPLVPDFQAEQKAVCVGEPVYLFPKTDSTTVRLGWEMEGQMLIERDLQACYQHAFESSGIFPMTLSVHSRACPDTSYTDSIRVYPMPEVDLGGDSRICLNGQPVYLKNLREAPLQPYRQVWSTGGTSEVLKVVHPGVYTLSVTTDPVGCTTTESITISKDCYIDIPNAFTPEGDGHNDYFLPRQLLSESLSHFRMQVFNRWGQLLFETNRPDGRGWDGNFNGKPQPIGVYLYRIEADFSNGRQEQYEGNVTLLR